VANRAAADQLVANVLPIVRTIRASPASLASLRRSMLVTFEPRAAAPGIPRQRATCSLGRRLDFLGGCLARYGLGKFLPRVMGERERTGASSPDKELLLEQVSGSWPVSTDPSVHIEALNKLFDSGVTIVKLHSGQPNQQKVIEFYKQHPSQLRESLVVGLRRLLFLVKTSPRWGHVPARRQEVGCAVLLTSARQPRAA